MKPGSGSQPERLTVRALAAELGLELAAARRCAGREIRWVHSTELTDPTPWLQGGELILTTGIALGDGAAQRAYVRRLRAHGCAGLGLGLGFEHERLPAALSRAAEEEGLPLFAVPYEMPFIAITEHAFTRLVHSQYAVLERAAEVHERLERLALEGRGLDGVLAGVAEAVEGSAVVLDPGGELVARAPARGGGLGSASLRALGRQVARATSERLSAHLVPDSKALARRATVLPVPGSDGRVGAWLAVARAEGRLGELDRIIARQAALVIGLELLSRRLVAEAERRLAGDVVAEVLSGRLDGAEIGRRLEPFGIEGRVGALVFELEDPTAGERALEAALEDEGVAAAVSATRVGGRPLLAALIDAREREPVEVGRAVLEPLAAISPKIGAAASRELEQGDARRAFHEARCALEAQTMRDEGRAGGDGDGTEAKARIASPEDLGSFTLLLALQDDEALELYTERMLGGLEDAGGEYGEELRRSVEAFIEHNGNWERAARSLFCHRHTLRYRIRKAEELTGRDLSRASDRIELWLALRARELI